MAKTLTSVRFLRRRFDLHLFFSSSFSSVYYLLWPITLDNDVPLVRSLFSKIYDWLPLVTTCCHSWRRTTMNSMIVIDCSIACSHDWSTSSWYVLLIEPHLKFETNTFQWSVILGSDGGSDESIENSARQFVSGIISPYEILIDSTIGHCSFLF